MDPTADWILFEDEHLIVVDKPAGLASQGRRGEDSVEERIRLRLRPDDPGRAILGMPQRLDRPVSGVLVLAKTTKAARRLAERFAARTVLKEYWAVVEGDVEPSEGTWDDWLLEGRRSSLGPSRTVAEGTPGARRAFTRYQREHIDSSKAISSWLRLWPETGRRHQLRSQASSRGFAIVGDRAYGSSREFGSGSESAIALHARRLSFEHPTLFKPLTIVAEPPRAWIESGFAAGFETADESTRPRDDRSSPGFRSGE